MKFDFIIGNPPYQEESVGEQKTFMPSVYHTFIDKVYELADKIELIHPAKFLFNAGSTPKNWNRKMLSDPHLKVIYYYSNANAVFPNAQIEGGLAITYHDINKNFTPIGTFTAYNELNNIIKKVENSLNFKSFMSIVLTRTSYRLTKEFHADHPEAAGKLSDGHLYDMATNIFSSLPFVFYDYLPDDSLVYISILGRENNKRVKKYIQKKYVNVVTNLNKWKVFIPKSNGSGALGKKEKTPVIGIPQIAEKGEAHTESFISIGAFEESHEAESCLKYIKTKFVRCLVGILKVTQDNPPSTWEYVPLQDFTDKSDIDWSKSIPEIDQQLYDKYGLDNDEIAFIESHVREME